MTDWGPPAVVQAVPWGTKSRKSQENILPTKWSGMAAQHSRVMNFCCGDLLWQLQQMKAKSR